ncbi:hypothetical protein G0Q06_12325 [Puniceicoccales bacterium CK1056]|uniref:Uncharacterized protein n=1 Tax=Oceanipulchritudo coccoides TaxID=2706888 RepID=A0A6B2M3B3_9BACT|nr:hypothetical protein [Oceanipulchritudo coccoides]NDV63243.1 hypothetical protein [Oceanipulchritudo coccoides]
MTKKTHLENTPPSSISPDCPLTDNLEKEVKGSVLEESGQTWYRIERTDLMGSFLMSLISDSDHWLFITSSGALTAGRINPDHALLPYYTQDKIEDLSASTGSRTIVRIHQDEGATTYWEPFTEHGKRGACIERHLQKNTTGNHIILEERNKDLGLLIRISWRPSGRFGFVRKVEILNESTKPRRIEVLDGLQNILPPGLAQRFQNEFSILGNAYKQTELVEPAGMGIYHLSSEPTDLASPMEALRANIAWQCGLDKPLYLISEQQLSSFLAGGKLETESECRGKRGSYLTLDGHELKAGGSACWYNCADVDKEPGEIEELLELISSSTELQEEIEADCERTQENLLKMLGQADGLQKSNESSRTMRHTSNTVFNLMRGGALITGYELPVDDVVKTVTRFNKEAGKRLKALLPADEKLHCRDPWSSDHPLCKADGDARRLVREYLPLSFSRRHGDPSRPWNRFSIEIKEDDGSPRFNYQGNWRDIFQNWEALLHSYPEYLEAAIFRFLNATTADGYNPYRLTKEGFEWEELEPGDAWANIGYWGDHQIIYLLRLLEASTRFHPDRLAGLLSEEGCVYAEIPYRIRSYEEILNDPRETIDYDEEWAKRIEARVEQKGSDGKLMHGGEGAIINVSLMEKLLAPLMAKLSNFVPSGGIWMNTQRPEWNDANNALVGYGISVVTLGYVARYLRFLITEFGETLESGEYALSSELGELLTAQINVFTATPGEVSPQERFALMQKLGQSASDFRGSLYDNALSGTKTQVTGKDILEYAKSALAHVELCLRENKREDALWHSYNLIKIEDKAIEVSHLHVMLEGQVSILSAGILDTNESLELLKSLRESELYRADQDSYILYPNKRLPDFLDKNCLSKEDIDAIPLLLKLVWAGNQSLVRKRSKGSYAFSGKLRNKQDVENVLNGLAENPDFSDLVSSDGPAVLELFENTFNHHAFTGRSGTFFAYEGLGSIYWHMVSKLVLAVQELIPMGDQQKATQELIERYRALRDGIGISKNPALYGAIPTDAYSHTPEGAGAQQPGMTGQVKEDLLIRMAELGVYVADGLIGFRTDLLSREELLDHKTEFVLPGLTGGEITEELPAGSLAYSFCQVPVIYLSGQDSSCVSVELGDGTVEELPDMRIPKELSREIFNRTGKVARIRVRFP